jgi:hypothetical protein
MVETIGAAPPIIHTDRYCITQTQKNTQTTKNISTPTEKSTTKMALTSWTEYHESLLKNEPWVEKLKKQSEATLEFVNNPKGLMTTVAKAAKMEERDEDDLERIIHLIPGMSKMIRVIHSCFVADGKIWGIHGTHVTSPIVDVPGQKACASESWEMHLV